MRFPTMWYVRPAKGSDQPAHIIIINIIIIIIENGKEQFKGFK